MVWIQHNRKQVAPLVRTGGSRHTGLAAPPHRNIQSKDLERLPACSVKLARRKKEHISDRPVNRIDLYLSVEQLTQKF